MRSVVPRASIAAICLLSSACSVGPDEEPPSRLRILRTDESGGYVWYDMERGEECRPHETAYHGTRCLPLFTCIDDSQLGYRDAGCRHPVAWTGLDRPGDRYVATFAAGGSDAVDSIFGVLMTGVSNDRYSFVSGECVYDKTGGAGACADITARLHPREFAPVNACGVGFVETRLSAHGGPEIALCRECDHDCDAGGDPCDMFGDPCDFRGKRGVCSTCCNGFTGELRCYPDEG